MEGVPQEGHRELMCGFTLKSVLFYQSVEIKMLLPLLQFGREHRGGGGQNVSGNPGQRTQGRTDSTQL